MIRARPDIPEVLDGEALKGNLDSEPIDGLPWPLVYMRVPPSWHTELTLAGQLKGSRSLTSLPPIRTSGFFSLIINSLILYLRARCFNSLTHTHSLTLTQAPSPSTTVLDNHYLRELVTRHLLTSAARGATPLSSLALLLGLGLLFKNLLPPLI